MKKIFRHTTILIDILFIITLILNYLEYLPAFFNILWIFYFVLFINTWFIVIIIKHIPEDKKDDSSIIYYSKYLFLLGLIIITINQFLKRAIVIEYMPYITGLVIAFGFLTFYAHREKVEQDIEKEKTQEENNEKRRKEEFGIKFPRLAKLNLNYGIINSFRDKHYLIGILKVLLSPFVWLIRLPYILVKWGYGEGWLYSGLLILILALTIPVLAYNLGSQYMWTDETYSFNAAKMILQKGVPLFDSGLFYSGAIIYHYLLAGSMMLFGVNNLDGRIINVLFEMVTILTIYLFFRDKNKMWGLLGGVIFLTLNTTIAITRQTRMYSLLTFLFTLSILSFYNALVKKSPENKQINLGKFTVSYNLKWLLIFIFVFFIAYNTHNLSLTFFFGLLFFYLICCFIPVNRVKNALLAMLILALIMLGGYIKFGSFNPITLFFNSSPIEWADSVRPNPSAYLNLIINNFSFFYITLVIAIILIILSKDKLFLLLTSTYIASFLFIVSQKGFQERYLSYLFPTLVLIFIFSVYYLTKILNKNKLSIIFMTFIIFLLMGSHFYLFSKELTEINKYDANSISTYKKLDFNKIINYTRSNIENSTIIADWNSAFTLNAYGINISFILLPNNDYRLKDKNDQYFNITYLEYSDENIKMLENSNKTYIIVVRDDWFFENINSQFSDLQLTTRPKMYTLNRHDSGDNIHN